MLLVYVPLSPYLSDWLTHGLGSPVRFPRGSYENALIARHLSTLPKGCAPQLPVPGCVAVSVPCLHGKPPEVYNYLPRRAMALLAASINDLFTLDLWHGLRPVLLSGAAVNAGIEAWCKSRGIRPESRESVRQRFYRLRRSYERAGIITYHTKPRGGHTA